MEFSVFQSACKYMRLAYDDPDDHINMSAVCNGKRPPGESWGKCDKVHCPYFGVEGYDVQIFKDGELIGTAEKITMVFT